MPCRPVEYEPGMAGHGSVAAMLLIGVCEELHRDPPIWSYDQARDRRSTDPRPTVALCKLLRELPEVKIAALSSRIGKVDATNLEFWWQEHKAWDQERESRET